MGVVYLPTDVFNFPEIVVFRILDVGLVDSMLYLHLYNVYLRILPTDLSILSSDRNKIKIFAFIIWILEFSWYICGVV